MTAPAAPRPDGDHPRGHRFPREATPSDETAPPPDRAPHDALWDAFVSDEDEPLPEPGDFFVDDLSDLDEAG